MKKILLLIIAFFITMSVMGCNSNEVGLEMESKFTEFISEFSNYRYMIVKVKKMKVSLGGAIGIQSEIMNVIVAFDRDIDEMTIIEESFFDSTGTQEHSDDFETYLFDFPFSANDVDEYTEDHYYIEMRRSSFINNYEQWYYVCEMDQGNDSLSGIKVVIYDPDELGYRWLISGFILSSGKVGEYPLYQTTVTVEFSHTLNY